MFDQGPHAVLRRDGVCIVLKTPTDEMAASRILGC